MPRTGIAAFEHVTPTLQRSIWIVIEEIHEPRDEYSAVTVAPKRGGKVTSGAADRSVRDKPHAAVERL